MDRHRLATGASVGAAAGTCTLFTLTPSLGWLATLVAICIATIVGWLAYGPGEFVTALQQEWIARSEATMTISRPITYCLGIIALLGVVAGAVTVAPDYAIFVYTAIGILLYSILLCCYSVATWATTFWVASTWAFYSLGTHYHWWHTPDQAGAGIAFAMIVFAVLLVGAVVETDTIIETRGGYRLLDWIAPPPDDVMKIKLHGFHADVSVVNGLRAILVGTPILTVMLATFIIMALMTVVYCVHNDGRRIAAIDAVVGMLTTYALCAHWHTTPVLTLAATLAAAGIGWMISQLHYQLWLRTKPHLELAFGS